MVDKTSTRQEAATMANDTSNYPEFVFIAYDEDFSAQTHDVAVSLEAGSLVGVPVKYVRCDWNTRPAPATTDTGMETFSVEKTSSGHPYMKSDPEGDYVTRAQAESEIRKVRKDAEELLAAERAESDRLRKLFKTQSAVHSKHVKELIAQHEREREIYGQAAQDFRERAEKAEADNLAKDARIKELEHVVKSSGKIYSAKMRQIEALEAKLAAARRALTMIAKIELSFPEELRDIASAALEDHP